MTRPKDKFIIFPDLEAEKRKREKLLEEKVKEDTKIRYKRERIKDLADPIERYRKLLEKYTFELESALKFKAEPETILVYLLEATIALFKKGLREYERDQLKDLPLDANFQRQILKLSSTKFNIGAKEFRSHFLDRAEELGFERGDADRFFYAYVKTNRFHIEESK